MAEARHDRMALYQGKPIQIRRFQDVHPGVTHLRRADALAVDRLTSHSRARIRDARVRRNNGKPGGGVNMAKMLRPNVRESNENPESQAVNRAYAASRSAAMLLGQGAKKGVRLVATRKFRKAQKEKINVAKHQIKQLRRELKTSRADDERTGNATSKSRSVYKIRPASELLKKFGRRDEAETKADREKRAQLRVLQSQKKTLKQERKGKTKTDLGAIFATAVTRKGLNTVKKSLSQPQDQSAANYAEEMTRKSAYLAAEQAQKAAASGAKKAKNALESVRTNTAALRTNSGASLRNKAPNLHRAQDIRTAQNTRKSANTVKAAVQNQAKTLAAKKAAAKAEQAVADKARIQTQKIAARAAKRAYEVVRQILVAMAKAVKTVAVSAGAGGFFLVLFVLIFGAAAAFASPWGIFYGEEDLTETGLKEAVQELSGEWLSELNAAGETADNDFGSEVAAIPDMYEVLCVYAVYTSTDKENPQDVATMTDEKKEILKKVINDMRGIASTQVTVTKIDETTGNEYQVQVTQATIKSRNWQEMIAFYDFDGDQAEALEQLIKEDSMFKQLMEALGYNPIGNSTGQISQEEWEQIIQNAGNMDAVQAALVEYARQYLGNRYSQELRGQTYYENGVAKMYMDCSYYMRHIYRSIGIEIAGTAGYQKQWCEQNSCLVDTNNLQVGDLVFFKSPGNTEKYDGVVHVGIYIGGGKMLDASYSNGKVVCRDIWSGGDPYLYAAGRPLATTV